MKYLTIFVLLITIQTGVAQNSDDLKLDWQKKHDSKLASLKEFNDAKFGMFIHWGLYSQLAGEYKGTRIPGLGEWIMYHAFIPRSEYKLLANTFNPTKFNAGQWVKYAKDAGMKYLVITAKHHDGFAMYDSKVSDYNIVKTTPFQRDPVNELYLACKKNGIRFGVYYSQIIDWYDGWDGGMLKADRKMTDMAKENPMNTWDPNTATREEYLQNKAIPQVKELITKYPDMLEVWFDYWYVGKGDLYNNPQISTQFYNTLYDVSPKCLVSTRIGGGLGDFAAAGDNVILTSSKMSYWETPGTLNNTWGYSKFDNDWKSPEELLFWIVDIASNGGNYLLNVGPKPDGTFPLKSAELLKQIGSWMSVNGDAIYGSSKWIIRKEGPSELKMRGTENRAQVGYKADFTSEDLWFTAKENKIFVIGFKEPASSTILVKALSKESFASKELKIKSIHLLGSKAPIKWMQTSSALEIQLPKTFHFKLGYTFEINY